MKIRSVVIMLIVAASLAPLFYLDQFLKRKLQPRRSMGRLGLYLLIAVSFVFVYTFFIVLFILHLFPVANK